MIHTRQELSEQYSSALTEYLAGGGEPALHRAYELGRQAMAEGFGVLEMVALHQKTLVEAIQNALSPEERSQSVNHAASFLVETLSPFEMASKGFQEANSALQDNLKELRRAEEELRRQNQQLAAAKRVLEAERLRYQELFDFAPDGYLVTDLEGKIQEANRAVGTLLGSDPGLLVGIPLLQFVSEEGRPIFQSQLKGLLSAKERKKPQDLQVEMRPRRGSSFPATLAVRVVRDEAGHPVGLRWLVRDITERKKAEEERAQFLVREQVARAEAEAARRFAFLADASALLVASLDYEAALKNVARLVTSYMADWCSVYVTEEKGSPRRVALAHADHSQADLARQLERFQPLHPRAWQQMAEELDRGRPLLFGEVPDEWLQQIATCAEHLHVLRQIGFCSLMIAPLHAHGRTLGAVTIACTTSGRRYGPEDLDVAEDLARRCALAVETARLYQAVTVERDKAAHGNRAKDEFLAVLSHELRNPLTPILGWARKLKKHQAILDDDVLRGGVLTLERNALNIMRLVEDCTDLARISERKISLEKKRIDLNPVVEASLEAVREQAFNKGLRLEMNPRPSGLWIMGDHARLEQVATNVLTNAVKYTGAAGVISVACSTVENEAAIEFKDTGMGIVPEYLEQIFEPFRQGSAKWLTSESGLGLGLAIARQIVELHGGRIWAQSEGPGQGSTFHLRLPLAPEEAAGLRGDVRAPGRPQDETKALRVLLIEDSQDIVHLMKMELEAQGYFVLTATDGEQGLELARRELPDVIISDIKMPQMDGYELLQKLRRIPELVSTPAIALTGLGMKKDLQDVVAAGYQALVGKPVDAGELSNVIQRLVGQRN